jgi:hypothetical protein
MPDDTSSLSSIEVILKEQLVEMRAMRALLESMDKKLETVYEITEEKAASFSRSDQTK